MVYKDFVYGDIDIKESVILDLIKTRPIQRLKKITQHGPSVYNKYYRRRILTRFEHSLGVYILLNKLNTSLEEQIAGLLHDVGHTVFSHAIDFLFPEENGEYDKKFHKILIENSDIPRVLKKYGINMERVLNESNFTVLERSLPDLCADRIDYFLKDPFLPSTFLKNLVLDDLVIHGGRIVFKTKKATAYFSKQYLKMNELFWARPLDELLYFIMVDIVKFSLEKKFIKHSDLFLNEDQFSRLIIKLNNPYINEKLKLIKNLKIDQVVISKKKIPNSYLVKSKIRVVDPCIKTGDGLVRLSSIDPAYKKKAKDFYQKHSAERWIGYVTRPSGAGTGIRR